MAKTNDFKLSDNEVDQLREIINIGSGNAATALSHMVGKKINMDVPESSVGPAEQVQRKLGSLEEKVVAIFLKVHGDIEGAMVVILPAKSAIGFAQILTKIPVDNIEKMQEIHMSSIQEMGNILLGASITALNKFLDLNMIHSIPDVAVDMLGAIMDQVLLEIGNKKGEILSFRVNLAIEGSETKSELFYLFDPDSSAKILQKCLDPKVCRM